MTSTLVVVPTYQEAENIALLLGRVLLADPEAHVLVVDDNSPDGTGDRVAHHRDLGTTVPCCVAPARRAWGRRTARASPGRWTTATTWWCRWMPTSRTRPSGSRPWSPRSSTPT